MVHAEVLFPENPPKEFADRSVLWNSVENFEDRIDAQLARTTIISLPNDWSYELAVEVMREYLKRKMKCERIIMDAQKHAVSFYEKFGVVVTSDEYLEEGVVHVDMSLRM